MFIPFVVFPFFGAAVAQALLFYKAKNPIIRFSPMAFGVVGLVFCAFLRFAPFSMTADAIAETRYFAKFLALPFWCAIAGGAVVLGYVFYLRRIENQRAGNCGN